MKKNFETELPDGYKTAFVIDATNKKTAVLMNLAALAIMVAVFVPAVLIIRPDLKLLFNGPNLLSLLIFTASLWIYLILHELAHGAAYKLLTKRKLKFGITLSVAYCGVPDIFVYRTPSLIAVSTPLVVFGILFLTLTLTLPDAWHKTLAAFMLALHLGGCSGDLYNIILYLFRFRDPRTLTQDTGPRQSFYLPDKD